MVKTQIQTGLNHYFVSVIQWVELVYKFYQSHKLELVICKTSAMFMLVCQV